MLRFPKTLLRRFGRSEKGAMTVEAAILIPFMFILIVICYIVFDAIRQQAVNQRATYALVDMLSRETDFITPDYMTRAKDVLEFLSQQDDSEISLRVTVAQWDENRKRFNRMWSEKSGPKFSIRSEKEVRDIAGRLPLMVDGDQIIIVETLVDYEPPLNLGFLPREIETFSFASPRYTPQLLWCNNNCT